MARLILIGEDPDDRERLLRQTGLPNFYMEDFSILGLRVDRPAEAVALLRAAGYGFSRRAGAASVEFRSPAEVGDIAGLLAENGIGFEMADLVDGVYQA
ncbi:MAG: hypothetical protein ACLFRG_02720 [Desulfococcaceae bacterium]